MRERDIATDGALRVTALLTSSGRERDTATWLVCAEIGKTMHGFQPIRDLVLPDFTQPQHDFIERLLARYSEDVRELVMGDPYTFGLYRNAVLNLEGDNAKRLQTLLWSVEQILAFAKRETADEQRLAQLVEVLGNQLEKVWKVGDSPKDMRHFSLKHSRRYDLLPKHWREI